MNPIRVLVAEDSAVTREYLVHLLTQDPGVVVVGTARDGQQAVEQATLLKPDIILMDVHMPKMNGYEATREIMARVPTPIVVASASFGPADVAKSFAALEAGALTILAKPPAFDDPGHAATVRALIDTLKLMAEVKVVRRWPRRASTTSLPVPPAANHRVVRVVAVGASTGGPPVVAKILQSLPDDLPVPILLTQHITPGFVAGLAEWLRQQTHFTTQLATAGERVCPRTVYIAPDGCHMGITAKGQIVLTTDPVENGFCPSVSYLFRSVAEAYGPAAVGVLLTGMGRDGASGLQQLRQAGGLTLVQDEESSAVFGMPAEAIRLGAAQYTLAPLDIAHTIRTVVAHPEGELHRRQT